MKTAVCTLSSLSPYSQSKFYQVEKLNKESPADFEKRTWRERCHYSPKDRMMYMPAMAFKNCLAEAAAFLGERIPGKGQSTWSKHFLAGVLVNENTPLNASVDEVQSEWFFVPSDGKRGSGKRVMKCFPVIHEWKGQVKFYVIDETITEDVFLHHLEQAGTFIGLGRFRPRNGGFYGRFKVDKVEWQ